MTHKVTVARKVQSRFWWWDCTCGQFGYGPEYDSLLRHAVFHVHSHPREVSC